MSPSNTYISETSCQDGDERHVHIPLATSIPTQATRHGSERRPLPAVHNINPASSEGTFLRPSHVCRAVAMEWIKHSLHLDVSLTQ